MFFKLAWLNIWRNKRRTLITTASVFFAVILAILMRSMTDGVYDNMIHNVVSYSSGYLQLHKIGYWDEQSIDNSFEHNNQITEIILSNPAITHVMPRLESFSLASFADKTKGVLVLGIDPEKEKEVNTLHKKVVHGNYINSVSDEGIVIGEGLATQLKLSVNDTLVLLGQGYHAVTAAGKYLVKGIIKMGSPELNNNVVYMPLEKAQYLYGAKNRLTALSIMLNQTSNVEEYKSSLNKELKNDTYELMTWKEMMPELDQFIEADSTGHLIIISILYFIIAFGIFGTLLMMTFERKHEFGILIAIGMKKRFLAFMLLLESLMISLIGCIAGIFGGMLIIQWFKRNPIFFTGELKQIYENYGIEPIIYFSSHQKIFFVQAFIVLILAALLAFYPGLKVLRMKPIDAIKS